MQLDIIDFIAISAMYIFSFLLTPLKTSSMIFHTFIYKHSEARDVNSVSLFVWLASLFPALAYPPPPILNSVFLSFLFSENFCFPLSFLFCYLSYSAFFS